MTTFSKNNLQNKRFRSRGGVVGIIVSFLLGFVFAFIAVAGTVYYLATSIKVKDGIEKVASLTGNNINYADYISEEYAEKTLLQLIKEDVSTLIDKAQNKTLCLDDFNAISPFVGTKIETLTESLKNDYGIAFASEELMQTSVSGMVEYLRQTVYDADLGAVLSAPKVNLMTEENGNYDLLMAICYGDQSYYEIVDGEVVMKEGYNSTKVGDLFEDAIGVFEKAPLDKVLGVTAESDTLLLALCYGNDYEIVDGEIVLSDDKISTTLGDLLNSPSDVLFAIELGSLLQLTAESDKITLALAYGKEDKNYSIDENGKIVMLPVVYTMENGILTDEDGNAVEYDNTVYTPIKNDDDTYSLYNSETNEYLLYSPAVLGDLVGDNAAFFDRLRDDLTLGELMDINEDSSQIMQTLKDKTLNELKDEDTINSLTLGELLEIDENDPNTSKFLIALKNNTIEELKKQETIDQLKLGEIIDIDDENSSKIMIALQDKTIADLNKQETIDELTLGEILEINENSSNLMQALQNKTIADLNKQETIDELTLGEVLEIDENSSNLMQALKNTQLADLNKQETIDNLKLSDVITVSEDSANIIHVMVDKGWTIADLSGSKFEEEITLTDILGKEAMTGNILGNLTDSTISTLADDINALTIQDVMGDEIYVDPAAETKELKGAWKYLLTDKETCLEGEYKITEMSAMVENMTHNVQKASINELHADNIIEVDTSFCEQAITYSIMQNGKPHQIIEANKYGEKEKIGELTISEMLDYLYHVVGVLNQLADAD